MLNEGQKKKKNKQAQNVTVTLALEVIGEIMRIISNIILTQIPPHQN